VIFPTVHLGGNPYCSLYQTGCGTVFKLKSNGKQVWLHSFNGVNGFDPMAGLLRDKAGNLYGTTAFGGKITHNCASGCGLVFKLDAVGKKETVLHRFTGGSDGSTPEALLIEDSAGTLYGTTLWGGIDYGVVFKMNQSGKETVLYTFKGGADGGFDNVGVIRDSEGNLYGATAYGGVLDCFQNEGCGTVYKVDSTGKENVLYSFKWGADGAFPSSSLIRDSAGNLYGTTSHGGSLIPICDGNEGCGIVFKLSPNSNGSWTETTLYKFCSRSNCTDGDHPGRGPLVRDAAGNLYGTTSQGGTFRNCNGVTCGVVFKLDTTGKETVLHSFTGGTDGSTPAAGLVMDTSNNLYGTTETGGDLNCQPSFGGCGVVFRITP
jgi:uncharacterized repeat protein (TIGR03803 family)